MQLTVLTVYAFLYGKTYLVSCYSILFIVFCQWLVWQFDVGLIFVYYFIVITSLDDHAVHLLDFTSVASIFWKEIEFVDTK